MLQKMRDKAQGWIVKTIIGVIVFTFAIFGLESLAPNRNSYEAVAEVNGQTITERQLMNAISQQDEKEQIEGTSSRIEERGGTAEDEQHEKMLRYELEKKTLESLIEKELLRQYAVKMDMSIPEESVDQMIRSMPEFQVEGTFDAVFFQRQMRFINMTPLQFRQRIIDAMLASSLRISIAKSEFITPYSVEKLNAIQQQTRDIAWLTLGVAKVRKAIKVEENDIKTYYQNNQATLMSEEKVSLEYVILDTNKVRDQVEISELDIEETYQVMIEESNSSIPVKASMILLEFSAKRDDKAALALANELKVRVAGGEEFTALAREYSDDPRSAAKGGDLGSVHSAGFMGTEFDAALAALAQGEVSQPVVTDVGVILIKRAINASSKIQSLADMRDDVVQRIKDESVTELFSEQLIKLVEGTYESSDLQQPAEELGLTIQSTELFGREGGEGIAGNSVIIQAAFDRDLIDLQENSEPLMLDEGRVAFIRIKEYRPRRVLPIAEVRDTIVAAIQEEKAHEKLNNKANAILAALASGKSESDIAKEYGVAWQEKRSVQRVEQAIPAPLLQKAFKLPYSDNVPSYAKVFLPGGDATIVAVKKVEKGKDIVDARQRKNISNVLSMRMGKMVYLEYLQTLINNADIQRFLRDEES